MAKKDKLLAKLLTRPNDFTWDETVSLTRACGFRLHKNSGASRMFVHEETRTKIRLHEPHPQNTLLPYMVDLVIEGLRAAGEIE